MRHPSRNNRGKRAPARLFGSPIILADEAISGWLFRLSVYHRIQPRRLNSRFGLFEPAHNFDFGDKLTKEHIDNISFQTLSPPELFVTACTPPLRALTEPVYKCLVSTEKGGLPLYKFCPMCLMEDPTPYVRRIWRVALSVVCSKHPFLLADACPRCGKAFDLSAAEWPDITFSHRSRPFDYCPHCLKPLDLASFASSRVDETLWQTVRAIQHRALSILWRGHYRDAKLGTISAGKFLEIYLLPSLEKHLAKRKADRAPPFVGVHWVRYLGQYKSALDLGRDTAEGIPPPQLHASEASEPCPTQNLLETEPRAQADQDDPRC